MRGWAMSVDRACTRALRGRGREGVAESVAKHRPLFAAWKQTSEERMNGHHFVPSDEEWTDEMVGKL